VLPVKRHRVRFGPAREARAPAPGVIPVLPPCGTGGREESSRNPFSESQFKRLKCQPQLPEGFGSIQPEFASWTGLVASLEGKRPLTRLSRGCGIATLSPGERVPDEGGRVRGYLGGVRRPE